MSGERLVLASGSAARRLMLANAGVDFEVVPAELDEDAVRAEFDAGVSHAEIAVGLAEAKARAVANQHPGALVIGSDQILSTGEAIFSKPGSRAEARKTLDRLRGRTHWLHSGVALAVDDRVVWTTVQSAALTMRALDDVAIDAYLDAVGTTVLGCVGAYQIEGAGIRLFEQVEGDHFTIMGMPLLPLLAELRRRGVAA